MTSREKRDKDHIGITKAITILVAVKKGLSKI